MSKEILVKYTFDSKEYTKELKKLNKLVKSTQKQLDKLNRTGIKVKKIR